MSPENRGKLRSIRNAIMCWILGLINIAVSALYFIQEHHRDNLYDLLEGHNFEQINKHYGSYVYDFTSGIHLLNEMNFHLEVLVGIRLFVWAFTVIMILCILIDWHIQKEGTAVIQELK